MVTLVRDGVAAGWDKIVEFAGNLKDMLIGAIKDFLIKTVVGKAIVQIASMLNPVGALIQACIKIYDTVMFVIERAKQIMEFVDAVIDSLANIARGNIGAAKNHVEKTLARILPLVISFLARFVGLGGLSDHIRKAIEKIQAPINKALDRLTEWIKEKAKGLVGKAMDVFMWWKKRKGFKASDGSVHHLTFSGERPDARLGFKSEYTELEKFLGDKATEASGLKKKEIDDLKKDMAELDVILKKYRNQKDAGGKDVGAAKQAREQEGKKIDQLLERIAIKLGKMVGGTEWGTKDKPLPMMYPKRPAINYRTLYFGPKSGKVIKQELLHAAYKESPTAARPGSKRREILQVLTSPTAIADWQKDKYEIKAFFPLIGGQLGNHSIGVSDKYATAVGMKLKVIKGATTGGRKINNALEPYGYLATAENMDGDHLVEMQIGGPNELCNLWPLNNTENRASGGIIKDMELPKPDSKKIKMSDVKMESGKRDVWLYIAGMLSTKN